MTVGLNNQPASAKATQQPGVMRLSVTDNHLSCSSHHSSFNYYLCKRNTYTFTQHISAPLILIAVNLQNVFECTQRCFEVCGRVFVCKIHPDFLQFSSVGCLLFLQSFTQLGADLHEPETENSCSESLFCYGAFRQPLTIHPKSN